MQPYLSFDGNCEAAFRFYEEKLGARLGFKMTFGESPMKDQFPADQQHKIMHANLMLDGNMLMGSDCPPGMGYEGMKGFSLSLSPKTVSEAEHIFAALSEGGRVTMPLEKTFWAERFGMLTDRFGVPWMINCEAAP